MIRARITGQLIYLKFSPYSTPTHSACGKLCAARMVVQRHRKLFVFYEGCGQAAGAGSGIDSHVPDVTSASGGP
jgi:hypothetical protein